MTKRLISMFRENSSLLRRWTAQMPDKLVVIQLILVIGDRKAKKIFYFGRYSLSDNRTLNLPQMVQTNIGYYFPPRLLW